MWKNLAPGNGLVRKVWRHDGKLVEFEPKSLWQYVIDVSQEGKKQSADSEYTYDFFFFCLIFIVGLDSKVSRILLVAISFMSLSI